MASAKSTGRKSGRISPPTGSLLRACSMESSCSTEVSQDSSDFASPLKFSPGNSPLKIPMDFADQASSVVNWSMTSTDLWEDEHVESFNWPRAETTTTKKMVEVSRPSPEMAAADQPAYVHMESFHPPLSSMEQGDREITRISDLSSSKFPSRAGNLASPVASRRSSASSAAGLGDSSAAAAAAAAVAVGEASSGRIHPRIFQALLKLQEQRGDFDLQDVVARNNVPMGQAAGPMHPRIQSALQRLQAQQKQA
mmetsp:Transcript_84064/g.175833  ORF Transcript_84064/g.175833 Transcript_84064/m.175833 type:complete len:253 (-) Transcript_84064:199-957(-)|eukprot:CAMPEP_0206481528 /NCGR_PEP_ID=MMETSP0324_2-20121206/38212_1 /ASSEMBLY_ACC=CAM_ASM_000836 /TAXON_ID=2866 /ORGANISM="Crypthecodinium cohnii, Strain Seligo" /LENGTH=252 /DNA_ID=CAMNT_0053959061 /DNA_START=150 /DNA_END=908 /DNA_ORIENTATION=+